MPQRQLLRSLSAILGHKPPPLRVINRSISKDAGPSSASRDVEVKYRNGVPTLVVPLPSRNEPCLFTLRPLTDNVGALCEGLRHEDKGIDYTAVYDTDGVRVSLLTPVEHLLQMRTFSLRINDSLFDVHIDVKRHEGSEETLRRLDNLREAVSSLHASLCIDEYKRQRELRLAKALEDAESDLLPLEQRKAEIVKECEAHANRVMWALFGAMGLQVSVVLMQQITSGCIHVNTGVFARLTWWEYSWDIMEPVTYFSTYLAVIASAAYYLHTKQPFDYPLHKDRIFTRSFHKRAAATNFDVQGYIQLVEKVDRVREELRRVRDPLFHHLPMSSLMDIDDRLLKK